MTSERDPLAVGQIVHGEVIAHHPWGIELKLEEADAYGTVDLRFLSDDPADMNEHRFPRLGKRVTAKVQGTTPGGQLRLTIRGSDLN
jgi:hypothetical protein